MTRRVLLLGLDGAPLDLIDRFADEGALPNLARLRAEGASGEALPSMPPATPVNWTTIATGTHAAKHGIVGMRHAAPEELFTATPLTSSFYSQLCKVPKVYEAAEAQGRDVLLLKYTTSWPPTLQRGIVVDGFGDPGVNVHELAPRLCFSTRALQSVESHAMAYPVALAPCAGRAGCRQATLSFGLTFGGTRQLELIADPAAGEVELRDPPSGRSLTRIKVGAWSPWVSIECEQTNSTAPALMALDFRPGAPERRRGAFRAKLVELSADGRSLTLYLTRISAETGWAQPAKLASELREVAGPYFELAGIVFPMLLGWTDARTLVEETEMQGEWMADALGHLLRHHPWQLAMTQWHGIDHLEHLFLGLMDPDCIFYDPARHREAEEAVRRSFQSADRIVGAALEALGEDDVLIVTSDHGQVGVRTPGFPVNKWLAANGYSGRAGSFGESVIWINLRGRQREGTVAPEDYESLRTELVKKLEEVRDEQTGERLMELVLRREDAGCVGLDTPAAGDIVFLLKPELRGARRAEAGANQAERGIYEHCSGEHHAFFPRAGRGLGSVRAAAFFHGRGIRRNTRLERPLSLVDLAPTMAHLLQMDPLPDADGRVLWEIFE